jgi:DNA-binding MarR family transcriptional regulator
MRDARDRRRVFIWLTPQGRAAASSHPEVLADDLLRKAVGNMQQVDRNRLVRGLRALLAAGEESS